MKQFKNLMLFLGMFVLVSHRNRRKLLTRALRLPPAKYKVAVDAGLRIPMRDGVYLVGDHYCPLSPESFPTILIRSPYGRNAASGGFGLLLAFFGKRFAERGYHVLIQDTRGRFDSEGVFDPYFPERSDGQATVEWMERQPWFNGVVGMWGPSYLGIVQWALAVHVQPVKALVPIITSSQLYSVLFPDGALDLGLAIRWMAILDVLERSRHKRFPMALSMFWKVERAIAPIFAHLPLAEADERLLGRSVSFYRNWLEHSRADDDYWLALPKAISIERVTAPAHFIGGWYDFFLRPLLMDYAALKASGRSPYLTIGPWHHFSGAPMIVGFRESLAWFDAHLKGDRSRLRARPVRIFVMGAHRWREYDSWPPPSTPAHYYLRSGRHLSRESATGVQAADHYTYDPAHPTPAVGGTQFGPRGGPRDNRQLEARSDVLIYTTPPLDENLEVIGPVRLELYVKSSAEYTDFFGRLCDVRPGGRSLNVCDGLFRVEPGKGEQQPDGSLRIEIDLWATAYCFRRGHSLRLQVSSGAHPRWMRNPGTGEPIGTYTTMRTAEQTIYHDERHPSAVILPVAALLGREESERRGRVVRSGRRVIEQVEE
jgi:uncharacterized protein